MEDIKKIQEFFSKPLKEGKQLDIEDFAKVVQAVTQTGHPVTVLLTPKFNEIEVLTGMNAPDDMLRDLSNAVDSLGYGRNDIIIAGDSSNLSRREYSDIRRVNGGHKDYWEESVNEASRARVSMPRFVKDKNNPNFLNVYIDYDLGPGGSPIALGKETMTGQIRRESAAEAMRLASDVAKDLEAEYNLEDIDIQDLKNGKVRIFAVSDDFINMNPNMLGEMDINDPVLMKMRAEKDKLAKMRAANAGDDGNDHIFRKARANVKKLEALKQKRAEIMSDMEQEAEPEGGPIADRYGDMLNKIDAAIAKLEGRKEMDYDTAVGKKGNEYMSKDEIERRASMISDPYADYTSKTNAMFGLEEDKPVANPNKHIKGIQIQLDQLGVKYEMDPKNKVQPFKVIYKPVNKDDDFYDKFNDIIFRYNLKGVVKTSMNEASKEEDAIDTITMDVPLFIRILEYAREDAQADMDLHDLAEKAIAATKQQGLLQMDDYDMLVGEKESVDEETLTEAYVPENIKEFAKRKGVSRLVNTVAGWAEKVGARITGGTAIGKYYDTLILDMGYQTSDIRINCDDETVELYYEPVNSFADFKRVFMEEEARKQAEHDEETLRREQGLEEGASTEEKRIAQNAVNKIAKYRGVDKKVAKQDLIRAAQELVETIKLGEGVIYEELCEKGKAYIKRRQAAGEKSSAYLSGRAVKVCKGQMSGRSKKK